MVLRFYFYSVAFIATRFSVYVINYERVDEATKVLTPKEKGLMSIDCICKVSDTRVGEGKLVFRCIDVVSLASLCYLFGRFARFTFVYLSVSQSVRH